MAKSFVATVAVFAVLALNSVEAHSKMTKPSPNSLINNSPSGTLDGPNTLKVPDGMHFDWGHETNTAAFLKAYKSQTKYTSIRQMIYDKFEPDKQYNSTKECGQSAMTGPPQDLPTYVEYETGFDTTHWGPCEVWCDDKRVFYEDNCAVKYPQKPAKVPYDKAKCLGAKRLQSFWLALHVPAWQAYISCATLTGK
jgi:hypothetical protein